MKAVILLFLVANGLFFAEIGSTGAAPAQGGEGSCYCGIVNYGEKAGMGAPLISKTDEKLGVVCTDGRKKACQETCIALAKAAQIKVPEIICKLVQTDVDGFKPALFYKACDDTEWTYTGYTCPYYICCLDGKQTTSEAEASKPTL